MKKGGTRRWVLMNPGPVNVTRRVRQSLLKPDICHRESEFSELLQSVRSKLLHIFGVEKTHAAAIFTGSGTAALEAMLSSYAEKHKTVLVLSNGVYGDRIRTILQLHGSPVKTLSVEIGKFPGDIEIEKILQEDPSIRAISMVHHETCSGMLNPLENVIRLAKKYKKTLLVDAVSSLGGQKVDVKNIDYLAGSSGKCLHGYPGLSFVIVSKTEAEKNALKKSNTLYLDLWNTLRLEEKNDTPFTPAVQLFYAFEEALKELAAEGLQNRIDTYARRGLLLEKGFEKMNLKFLVEKKYRSQVLTSLWMPKNLNYDKLHRTLKKNGFVIYAGQSHLAGKIFRVSNLGDMPLPDIRKFLVTLDKILKAL